MSICVVMPQSISNQIQSGCPLLLEQETKAFIYQDPNIPAELLQPTLAEQPDVIQQPLASHGTQSGSREVDDAHQNVARNASLPAKAGEVVGGTIDMTEMVAHLTTEDDNMDDDTELTKLSLASNNFGNAYHAQSHAVTSTYDEAIDVSRGSPITRMIPRSRPQSGVPSPVVPPFQQFPSLPGIYGSGDIWQNRPMPDPHSADGGWSPPRSHPDAQMSPWNRPAMPMPPNPNMSPLHAHHSSLPGNDGLPSPAFRRLTPAQQLTSDISVTPPPIGLGLRTPGADAASYRRQAFGNAPGIPRSSSSQLLDAVYSPSGKDHRSSWNQTPPNGQGG